MDDCEDIDPAPTVYEAQAGLIEALVHECGREHAEARVITNRITDLVAAMIESAKRSSLMSAYDWYLLCNQIRCGEHTALWINGVILEWNYR